MNKMKKYILASFIIMMVADSCNKENNSINSNDTKEPQKIDTARVIGVWNQPYSLGYKPAVYLQCIDKQGKIYIFANQDEDFGRAVGTQRGDTITTTVNKNKLNKVSEEDTIQIMNNLSKMHIAKEYVKGK